MRNHKKHWRNRLRKEGEDPDMICNNMTYDEFGCDEDDNFCDVGYEEGDEQEVAYDLDSIKISGSSAMI